MKTQVIEFINENLVPLEAERSFIYRLLATSTNQITFTIYPDTILKLKK